jgi:UDP-N-acetylmuramate--alanine ligase
VITNVEWDHPDCYPSPASFRRAFMQFTDNVDRKGLIVSCVDDVGAEQLRAYRPTRGQWITYGLGKDADLRATKVKVLPNGGYQAEIFWWQAPVGQITLSVPGIHNLWNALAALAVARYCNVSAQESLASLGKFPGIARRFELKGEVNGITVVDDYAHHPTEIMATLSAARNRYPDRRIWAIFQPHTFSRTKRLLYQMGESFEKADRVIVTDIYAAREQDDGTVHAKEIVATSEHPDMQYISELTSTVDYLVQHVQPGDVVITLGAGTSYKVGEWLLDRLRHSS